MRRTKQGLMPCEEEKPKSTEKAGFTAGSYDFCYPKKAVWQELLGNITYKRRADDGSKLRIFWDDEICSEKSAYILEYGLRLR